MASQTLTMSAKKLPVIYVRRCDLNIWTQNAWHLFPAVLERKLDLALDWLRLGSGNYLVYTKGSPKTWRERLKPLSRNVLIMVVRPDHYSGMMPAAVWDWLAKVKNRIDGDEGAAE